jgi:hypothetical protein
VLDGEEFTRPEIGTAQGSVLSPILANIYLHYALDLWFVTEVKPRMRGRATLIRYCDDFIIGFEREDDVRRVMAVLGRRLGRFGLALHPDKTRLVPFRHPPERRGSGKGPATFDFLGFTMYWGRSRTGRWGMKCKTRRASLRRSIQSVTDWCRRYRHLPVKDQHAALGRRLRGHFNYFGVSGNFRSLLLFVRGAERAWYMRDVNYIHPSTTTTSPHRPPCQQLHVHDHPRVVVARSPLFFVSSLFTYPTLHLPSTSSPVAPCS